jgi:hypothetical protein
MLVAPDAEAIDTPRDAPLGIVVVVALLDTLDVPDRPDRPDRDGRPLTTEEGEGVDPVLPAVAEGAGVTNPLGAGELKVGDDGIGDASDGAVNVDVAGTLVVGDVAGPDDVSAEDDPLEVPRLLNGRGAGAAGAAGRGKHGAWSVCPAGGVRPSGSVVVAGLGFATVRLVWLSPEFV